MKEFFDVYESQLSIQKFVELRSIINVIIGTKVGYLIGLKNGDTIAIYDRKLSYKGFSGERIKERDNIEEFELQFQSTNYLRHLTLSDMVRCLDGFPKLDPNKDPYSITES